MLHRVVGLLLTLMLLSSGLCAEAEKQQSFSFLPTREYDGVMYEARSANALTTVLLIGYDHANAGEIDVSQESFIDGGQADFLLLLVVDHAAQQVRQLHIDRDTMAEIRYYSRDGVYEGLREMQICLAHAYGATQEENNRNAVWAMENLLGIAGEEDGAQIDLYMAMDISGIGRLNDLLGGVTVPIENDFSRYDASMVRGTAMKLNAAQAEIYCRYRYGLDQQSNASRMKRQRVYMDAAMALLREKVDETPVFAMELLMGMGLVFDTGKELDAGFGFTTSDKSELQATDTPDHYLMVNQSLDEIAGIISCAIHYEVLPVEELPGWHSISDMGYIIYNMERDAGVKWALDALYRPLH